MRNPGVHIRRSSFFLAILIALNIEAIGQGRVVVNEYMPWSGCSTTNEFIELLNFGPGPIDIGCYIVTNGQYAVTIPPNTMLDPGEYYVLSGADVLPINCANVDSAIQVDLNWTTCNCTDKPIPTTGDGFMGDGGSSNEKIILLDANLNVLDAVSRSSSPSSSVPLTTASVGGGCTSQSFDLNAMTVSYETINKSTGVDNSFARKVDGDCGWVKTTAISAGAPNKTGNSASASYNFTTVDASDCAGTAGYVSIGVSAPDIASLFPMNYTLAFDSDSNNLFEDTDQYTYGTDNSPSTIDINNLDYGRYRITVGSSAGCNLQSFDFFIFNCYGVILPLQLVEFKYDGIREGRHVFTCMIKGLNHLKAVVLEGSEGGGFSMVARKENTGFLNENRFTIEAPLLPYTRFRLRMIGKDDKDFYSPVVSIHSDRLPVNKLWPNPVKRHLFVQLIAASYGKADYAVFNSTGILVSKGSMRLKPGTNTGVILTDELPPGIYIVRTTGTSLERPVSLQFVKQ